MSGVVFQNRSTLCANASGILRYMNMVNGFSRWSKLSSGQNRYEANFEFGENSVQLLVGILEVGAYAVQPVGTLLGAPQQADQEFVATHRKKANQERAGR